MKHLVLIPINHQNRFMVKKSRILNLLKTLTSPETVSSILLVITVLTIILLSIIKSKSLLP